MRDDANEAAQARYDGAVNFLLPLGLTAVLVALSLLSQVRGNVILSWTFWLVAATLLAWQALLLGYRRGRAFSVEAGVDRSTVILVVVQLCVFAYWGWYWPPVYDHAVLIVA